MRKILAALSALFVLASGAPALAQAVIPFVQNQTGQPIAASAVITVDESGNYVGPGSGGGSTDGLTNTQLRAAPVTVTGPLTDAQIRASALPVSDGGGSITVDGALTNSELRAAALPVSGTFWQTTQPVSAAALPLPSGASTSSLQTTGNTALAAIQAAVLPSSSATNALTPVATSAVSGGLVVKASAGNLYGWQVTSGASAGYVLVLNANSIPADGAVTPLQCVVAAANTTVGSNSDPLPDRHSTGIVIVFSTTGCFTKTTSATAFIRARFL